MSSGASNQITDHFFRFWYAFVFPNISELETGDAAGVWQYIVEPELDKYTSIVFEEVCRQYLRRENRRNALPFRFTQIGRWWNKNEELDILATDRAKQSFLIGECKFKNRPLNQADITAAKQKFQPKAIQVWYTFFSKSGFTEEVRAVADERTRLITAEDLLKG